MSSARSRLAIEPGLVHAGVEEHDPVARRHRPRVAVRHAGPGQRQAQAPDAGQQPLAAADLALAGGGGHRRRHLMHRVGAAEPGRGGTTMATDVDQTAETTRVAREYFAALGARRARRPAALLRRRRARRTSTASSGPAGRDGDGRPSSPSSSTPSPTGASRSSRRWPRATASRCAGAPAGPSPGPGSFMGFEPNGARVDIEGVDLVRVRDGRISAHRRLHERRRARAPARRAAAAGLGHRGADGQGLQPDHAGQAPPRRRPRAGGRRRLGRARRLPGQVDERLPRARRRRRDALRRGHQGDDRRRRGRRRLAGRHHARRCSATAIPTIAAWRPTSARRCSATPTTARTPRATAACDYFDFSKLRPYAQAGLPATC